MPKILCDCGNTINMSDIPCKAGYFMILKNDFEKLKDPIKHEDFLSRINSVVKCNICERLYFLETDTVYIKEDTTDIVSVSI